MGKFIVFTFLMLGIVFYEMSGGEEFEPELREPIEVAQTQLEPVETPVSQPEVTRADTASLIQISAPASTAPSIPAPAPAIAEPVSFGGPLPAGEVIITPAPAAPAQDTTVVVEQIAAAPINDIRSVAGDRVNMRSGPSTDYRVLDTLPRGTEAEILEVDAEGWARIRLMATGQEGWMAERLLTDS